MVLQVICLICQPSLISSPSACAPSWECQSRLWNCAWGGQRIEGFISEEALLTFPDGVDVIAQKEAEFDAFEANPVGADPAFEPNLGGQIYNGMVAPLAGYGLRGILFYQGEANTFFFASPITRKLWKLWSPTGATLGMKICPSTTCS